MELNAELKSNKKKQNHFQREICIPFINNKIMNIKQKKSFNQQKWTILFSIRYGSVRNSFEIRSLSSLLSMHCDWFGNRAKCIYITDEIKLTYSRIIFIFVTCFF